MVYKDELLGDLEVKANPRAKSIIFRMKEGVLYVTVPPHTSSSDLKRVIDIHREGLQKMMGKSQKRTSITPDFKIDTPYLKLQLKAQMGIDTMRTNLKDDTITLCYPSRFDFNDETVQQRLHDFIELIMQKYAKLKIVPLLEYYSKKLQLPYSQVKITKSKSRWGSCSQRKSINLSCYLLLLPEHLIEYVLVHELTHTLEMNHSDRFWTKLDGFLGKNSQKLRMELKKYHTHL